MKFVTRPPVEVNGDGRDDLDEALFAFFRSEMPSPWPALKLSAPPVRPPLRLAGPAPSPSRRPWFRSPRFALAASVALLIGGYALLSGALTSPSTADNPVLENGSGSLKSIKRDVQPEVPPDDGVGMDIEGLDQIGNSPTTVRVKVFDRK